MRVHRAEREEIKLFKMRMFRKLKQFKFMEVNKRDKAHQLKLKHK